MVLSPVSNPCPMGHAGGMFPRGSPLDATNALAPLPQLLSQLFWQLPQTELMILEAGGW